MLLEEAEKVDASPAAEAAFETVAGLTDPAGVRELRCRRCWALTLLALLADDTADDRE